MFLHPPLLRPDHQEVHQGEQADDRRELDQHAHAAVRRWRGRLGVGGGAEHLCS